MKTASRIMLAASVLLSALVCGLMCGDTGARADKLSPQGGTVTGVTAGSGILGGGTGGSVPVAVDQSYVQRRIATACAGGSAIQSVDATGAPTCIAAGGGGGGGTVTNIATTAPLTGGPITTTGTIGLTLNVDGVSIVGNGSSSPLSTSIGGACGAGLAFTSLSGIGVPTCTSPWKSTSTTGVTPVWTGSTTLGNGTTTDNGTTFTVGQLAGTHVQESTTGTFNDYALGSATTWLEFSNATAPTVTGIQGGVDGRLLYVSFTGTSGNLLLSNESASSSASNRIHGVGAAANNIANNGGGVLLLYDGVASRWRPLFMGTLPSLNVSGNTSLSSGTTTLGTTNISSAVNLTMSSTSQLHDAGTAPTLSTCGTSPTVTGGNIGGTIVTGTGAAACTATFARTFTAAPTCLVNLRGGGSSPAIGTLNATTLTFTAAASTTYDYVCVGH